MVPRNVDLVRVAPVEDLVEVPTLMQGIEIGIREAEAFDPLICDQTDVAVAHDVLPNHFNTMVCHHEPSMCCRYNHE